MDQRYQQVAQNERKFLFLVAQSSTGTMPVYSGDVALALHLRHRLVKDRIEAFYPALRATFGKRVMRIQQKRSSDTRALNGYMLPLQALLQVLIPYQPWTCFDRCEQLPIMYMCYGDGPWKDTLN